MIDMFEMKLAMWRSAWRRVRDEQWQANQREADRIEKMSDAEIYALALEEYGSAAAIERKNAMIQRTIHEAIQRHYPTRH